MHDMTVFASGLRVCTRTHDDPFFSSPLSSQVSTQHLLNTLNSNTNTDRPIMKVMYETDNQVGNRNQFSLSRWRFSILEFSNALDEC